MEQIKSCSLPFDMMDSILQYSWDIWDVCFFFSFNSGIKRDQLLWPRLLTKILDCEKKFKNNTEMNLSQT